MKFAIVLLVLAVCCQVYCQRTESVEEGDLQNGVKTNVNIEVDNTPYIFKQFRYMYESSIFGPITNLVHQIATARVVRGLIYVVQVLVCGIGYPLRILGLRTCVLF